jgi:hypothetical protein
VKTSKEINPITPLSAGTRVRCSKVSTENAEGAGLSDGYWLEGALFSDIEINRPIKIVRSRRARQSPDEPYVVNCVGMFTSSIVREIAGDSSGEATVKTLNSHWRITPL